MKTNETIFQEVKEANALRYKVTKVYQENGRIYRITANISLDDDCNNQHCDWSITGSIDEKKGNGRWYNIVGGCIHEEILKHFPKLKKFVNLHLCDCYGAPMYAVENGYYFMHKDGKEAGKKYLRLTDEEAEQLYQAPDKYYFEYLLNKLGVVSRWNEEARAAIKELEEMTGTKWVNPYTQEEEKGHVMPFTDEKAKEVTARVNSGYYTPDAIQARKEEARKAEIEKARNEIVERCAKAVNKAETERDVMLYILEAGLPVNNVIYYPSSNKVAFNWKSYETKISQEDFITFVENVDYSKLPDGITFEIR